MFYYHLYCKDILLYVFDLIDSKYRKQLFESTISLQFKLLPFLTDEYQHRSATGQS